MGFWTWQRDLYTSKAASDITSESYFVGDAEALTIQIVGSPSTTTVQGSNDNGFGGSNPSNWQTLQTLTATDIYELQKGFRWIRCQRSETTNAILAGQTRR